MATDGITAFAGARIFDGAHWHHDAALLVSHGRITGIGPVPAGATIAATPGAILAPGFVDLQVNGGGGVLLGPGCDVSALATICAVHARFGVTGLLPTLITDTVATTVSVISAGAAAARQGVPGFLGLHLEGPHLSPARKGAHDPHLIRAADEADLVRLERARAVLPHLLVTVAAETVLPEQIARLVRAGIVVSIGHSDASFEVASAAIRAGATMATHLFNAMSQLGNRDPGVVGAALHHGSVHAGLIADGIHVHPATFAAALAAKRGPGRIFLVSDSMSQAGTDLASFTLNGRTIHRLDGALRLADGTLAGADLTLDRAVWNAHHRLGQSAEAALAMATRYPALALGAEEHGMLLPGGPANFVALSADLTLHRTWRNGSLV